MTSIPDVELNGDLPRLDKPVLVVMLQGWIDAAGAANEAMNAIEAQINPLPIATFDADVFIDFRARRPTMEIRDGRNSNIEWPSIDLYAGHDRNGRDVLILTGFEPDSAWHRFASAVRELCVRLEVSMMVGLGAYPFPTPHTRPSNLSCTTPSADLLNKHAFVRTSVDVPAGMAAVLEQVLHDAGIPSISIWAQVPQYIPAMTYPAAAVALLDGLKDTAGLLFDRGSLQQEAVIQTERLDRLVAKNSEHQEMVQKLEQAYDAMLPHDANATRHDGEQLSEKDIPTPEELTAELEAFLRDANPDLP
ncbi:MAG: PAC2 family protein [Ilumatobacteraceae bacterium]|jgi:proteasome assembly chaperone (PAC2) family protein|nr:PAC2 family protein [Ilumatobacteraceae bacterium]